METDKRRALAFVVGSIAHELIARKVFAPHDFDAMAEVLAHRAADADDATARQLRMACAMLSDIATDGFIDPP